MAKARLTSSGPSPIHDAALDNDVDNLKTALSSPGARIDELDEYVSAKSVSTDNQGFTALHLAADRGHVDIVRVLMEAGANKSILVSYSPSSADIRSTTRQRKD
jgi:ankyrin repeat protein